MIKQCFIQLVSKFVHPVTSYLKNVHRIGVKEDTLILFADGNLARHERVKAQGQIQDFP